MCDRVFLVSLLIVGPFDTSREAGLPSTKHVAEWSRRTNHTASQGRASMSEINRRGFLERRFGSDLNPYPNLFSAATLQDDVCKRLDLRNETASIRSTSRDNQITD